MTDKNEKIDMKTWRHVVSTVPGASQRVRETAAKVAEMSRDLLDQDDDLNSWELAAALMASVNVSMNHFGSDLGMKLFKIYTNLLCGSQDPPNQPFPDERVPQEVIDGTCSKERAEQLGRESGILSATRRTNNTQDKE